MKFCTSQMSRRQSVRALIMCLFVGMILAVPAITPAQAQITSGFVFSQYKDVTVNADWNTGLQQSAVTGTVQPVTSAMPSNNNTLTWAFATGTCGSETWAGITPQQEVANVEAFVNAGKNYIVSTGGANGVFTCSSSSDFISFIQTYYSPNMLGVDFDIEGGQSQTDINNLVSDVAAAESQYPNLRFSFTIQTLGGSDVSLNQLGVWVVQAIQSQGLGGNYTVNLMTMDYGNSTSSNCVVVNGACQMGQSAVQAAQDLNSQYGIPYANIELTPMIGQNDTADEIFTLSDVDTVSNFVKSNGLAGVHFWSFDRDDACSGPNSGTCDSYPSGGPLAFTNQFLSDLGF